MTNLISALSEIVRQLQENGALAHERDGLQRQVKELTKEVAILHAQHSELMAQVRYGTDAAAATKAHHDTIKSELNALKKRLAPIERNVA
jgi:uncharacterized coiled-coil DUF342 family protein